MSSYALPHPTSRPAAQPKTDHRGTAEYKRHMVSVFVKRILVAGNGTAARTSTERAA